MHACKNLRIHTLFHRSCSTKCCCAIFPAILHRQQTKVAATWIARLNHPESVTKCTHAPTARASLLCFPARVARYRMQFVLSVVRKCYRSPVAAHVPSAAASAHAPRSTQRIGADGCGTMQGQPESQSGENWDQFSRHRARNSHWHPMAPLDSSG